MTTCENPTEPKDAGKPEHKEPKKRLIVHYKLADLFSLENLTAATLIVVDGKDDNDIRTKLINEIVRPELPRINKHTGINCNEMYLAYLLEWGARYGSKGFEQQRVSAGTLTSASADPDPESWYGMPYFRDHP